MFGRKTWGRNMDRKIREAAVSVSIFLVVLLVMSLVARAMMDSDKTPEKDSYASALDKLAGKDNAADNQKDGQVQDADTVTPTPNNQDNSNENTITPEITQQPEQPEPVDTIEKKNVVIAINADHQEKADTAKEPVGPGATTEKIKMSWGATGVKSGVAEYRLTLKLALALNEELKSRGYDTFLVRETNNVSLSEAERAKLANDTANIVIHIHANADDRAGISGIMAFYPSKDNKFVSALSEESKKLSDTLLTTLADETEAKNWGSIAKDDLTALNWSKIPVTHIEVGYLTNEEEDKLLQTEEYQEKIIKGIADGLDIYYGK